MSAFRLRFLLACALLHLNALASVPATQNGGWYVSSWGNTGPTYADQSTACVTGAPPAYKAAGGLDPSPSATWSGDACTLHRTAYWGGDLPVSVTQMACAENMKPRAAPATGCAPVEETNLTATPQARGAEPCVSNPIYPLTGAKKESVDTGISLNGVQLRLTYDSTTQPSSLPNVKPIFTDINPFGTLWRSSFHHKLLLLSGNTGAFLSRGDGQVISFNGSAGTFTVAGPFAYRLTSTAGGYLFTDTDTGTLEQFDNAGKLITLSTRDGAVLTFTYQADGTLAKVKSTDGRTVFFAYNTDGLISGVTGPDSSTFTAAYNAQNLASLTWQDGRVRTFFYENADFAWALTGIGDENNSRYATFAYDSLGRAISSEHAGGAQKYTVSYGTPARITPAEYYDAGRDVWVRSFVWEPPDQTTATDPSGQPLGIGAQLVAGKPSLTSQSQPAASGCAAASKSQSYDISGNVNSRVDFQGVQTCYAYDSQNREVARIEGLSGMAVCADMLAANAPLPAGARKISTTWHADWRLPTVIAEPLLRTTITYQGYEGASCSPIAVRADGKPVPLVCSRAEQALLSNGNVDPAAPPRTSSFTYDSAGRILTYTDSNGHTPTYTYYTSESFSGNPAGTYDADYNLVSVLLHGNGANGSSTFTDNSPSPSAVSGVGNAQISTGQSKFGGASVALDGSGDYLSIANSSALDVTSDFTIEFWVNPNVTMNSTTGQKVFVGKWAGSGNASWMIDYYQGAVHGYLYTTGNITLTTTAAATLTAGTWNHIAYTRAGSNFYLFVNGSLLGTSSSSATQRTTTVPALVGYKGDGSGTEYLNGYIDDLRITKGKARYTAGFSVPSDQLPDHGIVVSPSDVGHAIGDLQSITNAAGQVTQFAQYDRVGRVRQMVDAKGITTDITYTPRGWVSTVTVTPPGGSARTTSYTYDGVGQMTGVLLSDGTSLAYTYDAAHRLTGVTDTLGNSVTYTLDAAGNRVGEDLRDGTGALRRSIARSFDALNRLQQVTGAAQ